MRSAGDGLYVDRIYENIGFPELLELVDAQDIRILDVGCGTGANGRILRDRGHVVHGISRSDAEAERARRVLSQVLVGDVESMPLSGEYDAVMCSHVLEHLIDPWTALLRLRGVLVPGGRLYVALPNIAYYQQRVERLRGRFDYTETGIMDRTHVRFFTFHTAQKLARSAGFAVEVARTVGSVPLWPLRRLVGNDTAVDRLAARKFPNLFGYHILIRARLSHGV